MKYLHFSSSSLCHMTSVSNLTCASVVVVVVVGGHASRCPVVLYEGDGALASSWRLLVLIILLFTGNNTAVFLLTAWQQVVVPYTHSVPEHAAGTQRWFETQKPNQKKLKCEVSSSSLVYRNVLCQYLIC